MKNFIFTIFSLFIFSLCFAQTRISETVTFQNENKNYDIFVPSNYDVNEPNKLMVALHPWNVNRWNSTSWCDTLIAFADMNDLILICPDGGVDGQISDPIDTAFTTALIDSMQIWYNVNAENIFLMGFSWGAQVTYSYGLNNVEKFKGFLPIGAAITGTNEVNGTLHNATDKPFYIVHGNNDSPNTRYFPILDSLNNRNACVNSLLMTGVGHTIDFPNRNQILTDAFNWLDTVSCGIIEMDTVLNTLTIEESQFTINQISNNSFKLDFLNSNIDNLKLFVFNVKGQQIPFSLTNQSSTSAILNFAILPQQIYFVKANINGKTFSKKVTLQ